MTTNITVTQLAQIAAPIYAELLNKPEIHTSMRRELASEALNAAIELIEIANEDILGINARLSEIDYNLENK